MLADPIAELRSPSGALISVYLGRPSPGGMTALLTDLLRPVREAAEDKDRPVQKSVRADVERIHDYAERLEGATAPGYADGAAALEVLDDEVLTLTLTLDAENISEAAGPGAATGTAQLPAATTVRAAMSATGWRRGG